VCSSKIPCITSPKLQNNDRNSPKKKKKKKNQDINKNKEKKQKEIENNIIFFYNKAKTNRNKKTQKFFTDHGGLGCYSGRHEQHAVVHHLYAAGAALHQQAGGAEPAESQGVPQVSSSWQ